MSNKLLNNRGLEQHIRAEYAKIKKIAEQNQIYHPLNDTFHENTVIMDGCYCFSNETGYHYRVIERGVIKVDFVTSDLFEITYFVLSNKIFWMAAEYECEHRIEGQDFRRLLFDTELMLWNTIGDTYAKRALAKIENTLKTSPFSDAS